MEKWAVAVRVCVCVCVGQGGEGVQWYNGTMVVGDGMGASDVCGEGKDNG